LIAVDTNVLIHAHRSETRRDLETREKLTEFAEADAPWALPVFCLAEFACVVTHQRVFTPPNELRIALDFLDRLLESPSARLLPPSPTYARMFRKICESGGIRGNLAFDAQITASCLEHGVRDLITADRDCARFAGLSPKKI